MDNYIIDLLQLLIVVLVGFCSLCIYKAVKS